MANGSAKKRNGSCPVYPQTEVDLSNLNDKQNMLLTQLSYHSDVLADNVNNMTLEEILSVVYGDETQADLQEILLQLCDAGLSTLRIKDVGNNSGSGFGAIAFTDSKGNVGFSFRGTDGLSLESLNDWGDNILAAITGTSVQSAEAEAFFDRNRDASGNNYLYGHSKGGELAESVFVNNYNMIKGAHLLNPQPLNPYSLTRDQLRAIRSDKVDIVIVEGDYVWFLGALPSYGNVRIVKGNGENAHLYSAIENMYDDNGNLMPGNQPFLEYVAYTAILLLTTQLQIYGAGIGFVYNCVVRVVDFVRSDLIPRAMEFIKRVSDGVRKIGNAFAEYAHALGNFLTATVKRVKDWYRRNFNAGYKHASANPQIVVDTYKLRNYAQRLQMVNRRVSILDRRLDALYWKVGLLDLWRLMQADLLMGYSWRLNRCVSYLDDTATVFENAESALLSNL